MVRIKDPVLLTLFGIVGSPPDSSGFKLLLHFLVPISPDDD